MTREGDMLQAATERARRILRTNDLYVQYCGDKFQAIMLTDGDEEALSEWLSLKRLVRFLNKISDDIQTARENC